MTPKIQTFDGRVGEWEPFIFHFQNVAKNSQWSKSEKRDRLMECLRGKAILHIRNQPREVQRSYRRLKEALHERYSCKELPRTARRQLSTMRQEEGESYEDFADRVLVKAWEAIPDVDEGVIQAFATENFLRGCRDRSAACSVADKNPESVGEALQMVQESMANFKMFGRPSAMVRQVSFVDSDENASKPSRSTQRSPSGGLSADQESALQVLVEMMAKINAGGKSMQRGSYSPQRSRSPSPSRGIHCYNCGEEGHYSKECMKPLKCFKCKGTDHTSRDCPNRGDGAAAESRQVVREVNVASMTGSDSEGTPN